MYNQVKARMGTSSLSYFLSERRGHRLQALPGRGADETTPECRCQNRLVSSDGRRPPLSGWRGLASWQNNLGGTAEAQAFRPMGMEGLFWYKNLNLKCLALDFLTF